jgi:hypothetical protein
MVHTAASDLVQHAPLIYQESNGQRQPVPGRFTLDSGLIRFEVGTYDHSRPLVIDPLVLAYSTYLGGAHGVDTGNGVAVDAAGNSYVVGQAGSRDFPTTPGAFDRSYRGGQDAFVAKLNAGGSGLIYATYLGGAASDTGTAIAVDATGAAFVTGSTNSSDFPTTPGAFDTTYNSWSDAFVTKLNGSGSALAYSTYLGGKSSHKFPNDYGTGIAVDGAGNAYVTGSTGSTDFPVTPGAFDTTYNGASWDAFVTKLNAAGSALVYSTFLGGDGIDHGQALAVDTAGRVYVTGWTTSPYNFPITRGAFQTGFGGGTFVGGDAFVTQMNAAGSALLYSTYLGGSRNDFGYGIAVDESGNAYVAGTTASINFPTTPGAYQTVLGGDQDAFVAKVNASGVALVYGTYLGGSGVGSAGDDDGYAIAADAAGNAYVVGATSSTTFPTTTDAYQTTNHGNTDAFLASLNGTGSGLLYGTYLGGSGADYGYGVIADGGGNAFLTGETYSANFPTTPGAFQTTGGGGDAFVTKFALA